MLELLKKGIFAGIGAVVVTTDKIREVTRSLVEEGKLSTNEAEKLAEELAKSGERQCEEINAKLQSSFQKWSEGLEVVRKKEFQDLRTSVDLLEQRLRRLEETHKQANPAE